MADDSPKIYQFARGKTMTDAAIIMKKADIAQAVLKSVIAACKVIDNSELPVWYRQFYLACLAHSVTFAVDRFQRLGNVVSPTGEVLATYDPDAGWAWAE